MKLEEAVTAALTYLGDEMSGDDLAKSEYDEKIKLLIRCANIMLTEIAVEYMPLSDRAEVAVRGGKFSYEDLPRRVSEIISVTGADGEKIKFRQKPFSCETACRDGRVTAEYLYLPAEAGLKDDCDADPRVSPKTLALGACAEYCMIKGLYEQSLGFAHRFAEDIRGAMRPHRTITLPARRWS